MRTIIIGVVEPQLSWLALTSFHACLCHVVTKHDLVVNMLRHRLKLFFIEEVSLASVFIDLRRCDERESVTVPDHQVARAADKPKRIYRLWELNLAQKHLLVGPDLDQTRRICTRHKAIVCCLSDCSGCILTVVDLWDVVPDKAVLPTPNLILSHVAYLRHCQLLHNAEASPHEWLHVNVEILYLEEVYVAGLVCQVELRLVHEDVEQRPEHIDLMHYLDTFICELGKREHI